MTTKKKTTTAPKATKKSVTEPAAATKTVKPSKQALAKAAAAEVAAAAKPVAEGPVAPTVAAALVKQTEQPVAAAPAAKKQAPAAHTLTVGQFQQALAKHGCYAGLLDGHYGAMTRHAVCQFQAAQGLPVDGEPTPDTLIALGF